MIGYTVFNTWRKLSTCDGVPFWRLFLGCMVFVLCFQEIQGVCPEGWEAEFDGCYMVVCEPKLTFPGAQAKCEEFGANLSSIHSQEEQDYHTDLRNRCSDSGGVWFGLTVELDEGSLDSGGVLFGLTDELGEGSLVYVDGTPYDFQSWLSGNPDDLYLNAEDCAHLWHIDGHWNDSPCSTTIGYICKAKHDNEDPVISDIVVNTDPGSNLAEVTWIAPTATDNSNVVTLTSSHTSPSDFPIGITTVSYTATDEAGNQVFASFTITVHDNQNPTISDVADVIVNVPFGQPNGNADWTVPTANDNSGQVTLVADLLDNSNNLLESNISPPKTLGLGSYVVRYTATDGSGRTATKSFNIEIRALHLTMAEMTTMQTMSEEQTTTVGLEEQASKGNPRWH